VKIPVLLKIINYTCITKKVVQHCSSNSVKRVSANARKHGHTDTHSLSYNRENNCTQIMRWKILHSTSHGFRSWTKRYCSFRKCPKTLQERQNNNVFIRCTHTHVTEKHEDVVIKLLSLFEKRLVLCVVQAKM
jgi:hypothetical protein